MSAPTSTGPVPADGTGTGADGPAPDDAVFLPITAVTCLEDRAQVERTGTVHLTAGVRRLRIGPVTPLTVDRSLRAEISVPETEDAKDTADAEEAADTADPGGTVPGEARVVDARVVRSYTPPPPGEPGRDASRLRRDVHELERELYDARQARQRLESALAVIVQAKSDLHRDIVQCAGAGDADPERWADRLDRVDTEAEARVEELHRLRRRLHDIDEELREAREALRETEAEPRVLTAYVELVVETSGDWADGPARLRVAHLVPCAVWRPAYRATLAADGRSVLLETNAFVWQATGEDWDGVALSLSTARPTLAASPPELADDVLTLRDRSAEERRTVEVNLREEEISTVGGESPDGRPGAAAGLPGLGDGGAVRVLAAPRPVSVPSDRRPHRVHLSSFTAACRAERSCAPELSPLVVTTARFANAAGHVLLAGPVDLLRGSGFVGRGELAFAGVGEEVRLAFGAEDTFRVVRHVEESRDTAGLAGINQRTVILREARLFVSRLDATDGGAPQEVVIRERVPVSEISAVEVRVRTELSSPEPDEVDDDGIARWTLSLAPGERRELSLTHEITASSAVTGL